MSKPATKAANSEFYIARMAATSFNDRMASREGAAEETGIDRTRLARIELGSIDPYPEEVEVLPTWTEKSARKKAEAFAATFEKECKAGITTDSRLKFAQYADYVIDLKEQRGTKHSTIVLYRGLTARIYPAIGHIKLADVFLKKA